MKVAITIPKQKCYTITASDLIQFYGMISLKIVDLMLNLLPMKI